MRLREADAADWPEVAEFFLSSPLESGTAFVLDRRPNFGALPALRGRFRTFLVFERSRLAGTVTALWHPARDGERSISVGEVCDLRVAPWARGGRAVFHLLRASYEVFLAERVDWITCLIGKHNRAAIPTTDGRVGLPPLAPLGDFASVHFVAARIPERAKPLGAAVRAAVAADAPLLREFWSAAAGTACLSPADPLCWPDPEGRYRAWLAFEVDGTPCGALLTWDGAAVRRLRIVRYRAADWPLRLAVGAAARFGFCNPLPAPGEVFALWATRLVGVSGPNPRTWRALLNAALRDAAGTGQSALQVNLDAHDPLLQCLPPYPRSTYWSTLYGCRLDGGPVPIPRARYHADLARV